jgi:iron complex outermembrane receptor protein
MRKTIVFFKQYVLLLGFSLAPFFLAAQQLVRGQVVTLTSNEPVVGATVQDIRSGTGTTTDGRGQFNLTAAGDSLVVSYTGYERVTIAPIPDQDFLTVRLDPNTTLSTVIIQADPPDVSLRTAASVQRISRQQINRTDQLNPAPVLNQIPGLFMQSGALNTNRITIRGIGNRIPFGTAKIRAYLDDIPLTNGVGETVLEDIDLSLVDQIIIRKGPTASSYGAGLGGLIQYQTTSSERPASYSASQSSGSFGLSRTVLQADVAGSDSPFQLTLNGTRTHSDGYRANNTYDRNALTALARWSAPDDRQGATLFLNYNQVEAGIPSSLNETDFRNNPEMAAANWAGVSGGEDYDRLLVGFSHRRQWLSPKADQSLRSGISLFATSRNNYEVRPFNILRENNRALGFRTTLDWTPGSESFTHRITTGIEYYDERYDWTTNATLAEGALGELLSDQLENRRYYNLFAEMHWQPDPDWQVTAGINLNETQYTLTDQFPQDQDDQSGDYAFRPIWSPRLSISYTFAPRMNWYATVSHGFSAPTLEETLQPDGSRNPDIQPERGLNLETGSRGSFLFGRFSYEVSLYRMWITDLLVARRTALDQFIGINAGSSIHQGLEARLTYRLPDVTGTYARVSYAYSDYYFDTFLDGENDYSGNALTGQPPHQVGVEAQWTPGWDLYIHGRWRYTDAFPIVDDNRIYNEAYQVTDLRIGWQKGFGPHWQIHPYLGIQNIFDEDYASMVQVNAQGFGGSQPRFYYPGLPRNFYAGIRLEYQIK